mmetsp:Transcript_36983/g.85495  ORF Transcript_36983/g.85495 Transcript_36983/m.85495 type:complete len:219 (+) Transcript_36983:656-1312(+)
MRDVERRNSVSKGVETDRLMGCASLRSSCCRCRWLLRMSERRFRSSPKSRDCRKASLASVGFPPTASPIKPCKPAKLSSSCSSSSSSSRSSKSFSNRGLISAKLPAMGSMEPKHSAQLRSWDSRISRNCCRLLTWTPSLGVSSETFLRTSLLRGLLGFFTGSSTGCLKGRTLLSWTAPSAPGSCVRRVACRLDKIFPVSFNFFSVAMRLMRLSRTLSS